MQFTALETSPPATRKDALLAVENLQVTFGDPRAAAALRGVQDVSFDVLPGETLGIVGESGSGKTMSALSVIGLLPDIAAITGGRILWKGQEISPKAAARLRGRAIALIPQDAMTALNPLLTVETQIIEVLRRHRGMGGARARERVRELLAMVRIDEPARIAAQRPWQLSGGMAQRVVIAMALACEPELIIADEPTTALDVTVQAEILALMHRLQQDLHLALIIITHDLGVVAHMAQRTAVIYAGRVVESGDTRALFDAPAHPYTRGLIASTPHPFIVQKLEGIRGHAPLALTGDDGCSFRDRCDHATAVCAHRPPLVAAAAQDHAVACWQQDIVAANGQAQP